MKALALVALATIAAAPAIACEGHQQTTQRQFDRYEVVQADINTSLHNFSYWINNTPERGRRNLVADLFEQNPTIWSERFEGPVEAKLTYVKRDGFQGISTYNGVTEHISADVTITANYKAYSWGDARFDVRGEIGSDDIVMAGRNMGAIEFDADVNPHTGEFRINPGEYDASFTGDVYGERITIRGRLSDDSKHIGGEVEVRSFEHSDDAWDFDADVNASDSSLVGVFVAEEQHRTSN